LAIRYIYKQKKRRKRAIRTKKQYEDKPVSTNPSIVVRGPFSESELPTRSGPGEYFEEFERACARLKAGEIIEFDAAKITEHRSRKYLRILANKGQGYKALYMRTATDPHGGRRRVFIGRRAGQ
jgi:hypothetical protein